MSLAVRAVGEVNSPPPILVGLRRTPATLGLAARATLPQRAAEPALAAERAGTILHPRMPAHPPAVPARRRELDGPLTAAFCCSGSRQPSWAVVAGPNFQAAAPNVMNGASRTCPDATCSERERQR